MITALEDLAEKIKNFDSTANKSIGELLVRSENQDIHSSLEQLKHHLNEYDFDTALTVLLGILKYLRGVNQYRPR